MFGQVICPAVAAVLHRIWDSFATVTTESLRLQMEQLTRVQNENVHITQVRNICDGCMFVYNRLTKSLLVRFAKSLLVRYVLVS